jgi:hypothetical protein
VDAAADAEGDKHRLAARRWGDGRDDLGAAVLQGGALSSSSPHMELCKPGDASVHKRQRLQHLTAVRSGHGPACRGAVGRLEGFAAVGGMASQKEALTANVLLPLRHPKLFKHLGVQATRGACVCFLCVDGGDDLVVGDAAI